MNDLSLMLEFTKLLDSLRTSSIERFKYFYERSGEECPYVKKSISMFNTRDKAKLTEQLKSLLSELDKAQ